MEIIETKLKKWGNSYGVIIPKETIEKESINKEETIKLIIIRDSQKILKSTFGIGRHIKKSGQEFKDEARRELYR